MAFDSYTKLVINANGTDGATAYTAETGQTVTFVGSAQLDTAQAALGSASSILCDGTTDFITVPDSTDWYFASGDFTEEMWVRFNNVSFNYHGFFVQSHSANEEQGHYVYMGSDKVFVWRYRAEDATRVGYSFTWSGVQTNTWYHLAFVRNGGNFYIFIDGVSQTLTTEVSISGKTLRDCNGVFAIAGGPDGVMSLNGWVDGIRVSKGIARWTANFTPPSAEYTSSSLKSVGGLAYGSVKKVGGVATASIKKVAGLS